jgi:exosome complex component RRP42
MTMDTSTLSRQMLMKMFAAGKRFDGRKLLEFRDLEVEYGVSNKAEGSARVRLGKTEVVAGVKLAVGEPYPDSKDKGNLMVSADLLPMASPRFEAGPPKFNAIEIPRLVDRMIRGSDMIDLKELCITEGEKVWTVMVDIYPINDDGALIDVAGIAAVAALHNAVFPGLDEDGKVDYEKRTKKKLPLSEETMPLSFTFHKLGDAILLDPTREEEESCEARITLGLSKWNGQYMINSCQKGGEMHFTRDEMAMMSGMLPKLYDDTFKKLKKYLK